MSLESSFRIFLAAQSTVTDLVSTRIYPNRLPDNPTVPAVVYQRISTLNELASGDVPLRRIRLQVDCWGDRYEDVVAVAEAIHTAADMGSASGLHAMIPEDDDDSYDSEALLHRRRIDLFIWEQT